MSRSPRFLARRLTRSFAVGVAMETTSKNWRKSTNPKLALRQPRADQPGEAENSAEADHPGGVAEDTRAIEVAKASWIEQEDADAGQRSSSDDIGGFDSGLRAQIESLAGNLGIDAVGFASAEPFLAARDALKNRQDSGLNGGMKFTYSDPVAATDPSASLPGARSLVVGAMAYRAPLASRPAEAGAVDSTSRGVGVSAAYSVSDAYSALESRLGEIASLLCSKGWQALVTVDKNRLVDKEAAVRAGIGWYGKNTLVLIPRKGSWFVLGSVITDAPLEPNNAYSGPACGRCSKCIEACPTGAIVAPGVLDASKCLAWLLEAPGDFPEEHREALGNRIYGCDDCQIACPPNGRQEHGGSDYSDRLGPDIDLAELLLSSDEELTIRFARWYYAKNQPRYLRRNALVALGNCGDPASERTVEALVASLSHPSPMVRSHAEWAARKLGISQKCLSTTSS